MLKETKAGIVVAIKVTPKSHRNEVVGWENDELKVRIKAIPEKGNANEALTRFIAEFLDISPSSVTLVSGPTSRHKRLCIAGLTLTQLHAKILIKIQRKDKRQIKRKDAKSAKERKEAAREAG